MDRILTTHTGSLPRTPEVVELLLAEDKHPGASGGKLKQAIREAVKQVVAKQVECGLDIINDGEQGRTDYTVHVMQRLTGYDGPSAPPMGTGDEEFPELAQLLKQFASPFQHRPACNGPVDWKDWPAAQAGIDLAKRALQGAPAEDIFMTSPSPGQIARYLKNRYYKNMRNIFSRWPMSCGVNTKRSSTPDSSCSSTVRISRCCGTWSISTCRSWTIARLSPPMFRPSITRFAIFRPIGCACTCVGVDNGTPPCRGRAQGHYRHRSFRPAARRFIPGRQCAT